MTSDDGWSNIFAFAGSVVAVGIILVYLQAILVPFVLAIFLAYLVRPFAEWISAHMCTCRRTRRRPRPPHDPEEAASLLPKAAPASGAPSAGIDLPGAINRGATMADVLIDEATEQISTGLPRWVGVVLAMALAVTLLAGVIVLMASSVSSLGSRLDAYQQRAHDLWAIALYHLRPLGLELPDNLVFPTKAVSAQLGTALSAGAHLLNNFIYVLIFLVFLLLEPTSARSPLRQRIDENVSKYLVLKSLVCLSLACFTFLVLTVLRFPLALFLAIVTYFLSFIPNLGPMVAALLPLPICLLDTSVPPGAAMLAIILPGLAHVVVGNVIEPQLFATQYRMSPVVILFSLGVWWIVWGIVGAMLAVPLTSILRLIASDLMKSGEAGYYIIILNQLLEGRPLDSVTGDEVPTPRPAPRARFAHDDGMADSKGV